MDYTKRIDEILTGHREWMRGIRTDRLVGTSSEVTKQAITSLIKELVAEAKPEKQNTENMGDTFVIWARGHNVATDRFEQNLLKALEEVNG